jgi:hypothetical protein
LGVDQDHAYAWSRTRKGGWAIAQSPILGTTITLKRLKCLSTKYFFKIKFFGHSICPLKNNKNGK